MVLQSRDGCDHIRIVFHRGIYYRQLRKIRWDLPVTHLRLPFVPTTYKMDEKPPTTPPPRFLWAYEEHSLLYQETDILIMVLLHLVEAAFICATSWALWKILCNFVVKSPLDSIPGPPPASLWKGTTDSSRSCIWYWSLLGNLGQLFSRDGWQFHDDLGEKYGAVVKITGLFNVRRSPTITFGDSTWDTSPGTTSLRLWSEGSPKHHRQRSIRLRSSTISSKVWFIIHLYSQSGDWYPFVLVECDVYFSGRGCWLL